MTIGKFHKFTVLLAGFLLFSATTPLSAAETTIRGKVVEVDGSSVKIEYDGKYAPNVGDPVEIGFKHGDDFLPVEGNWKIVKVGPKFAWAKAKGSDAGTPGLNYLVVIKSENPQKRSTLVTKEEKPRKQIKGTSTEKEKKSAKTIYNKALQAGAEELRGKVIKVDGRLVRIVMESKMWPRVGDTVRLGQAVSGFDELIFMAGEWTVTKVSSKYVQAEAGTGVSGTPGRDYVAVIQSANPQKRTGIAPVEKISWKKADERFDFALKLWEGRNISQDRKKSLQLIQQGAREGHPVSMRGLGWIYERGEGGISQDYAIAVKWYRKAADAGAPNAYYLLGKLYEHGNGVKQSYSEAAKLYGLGAEKGGANAKFSLARLYKSGKGVARDDRRAANLYEELCSGGNASGCTNLGNMYYNGQGVKQDHNRAAELYEKACNDGNSNGCGNLGWMFYQGHGMAADQARGRRLMEKACTMGHQWSCSKLKNLGK